ncbi:MAG: hypothetical protein ACRDTD_01830 [Pseudonocardiaceae bacterium]
MAPLIPMWSAPPPAPHTGLAGTGELLGQPGADHRVTHQARTRRISPTAS